MRIEQATWTMANAKTRRGPWPLHRDLLAVLTVCVIVGLEIVALMQIGGGAAALNMAASEGMATVTASGD